MEQIQRSEHGLLTNEFEPRWWHRSGVYTFEEPTALSTHTGTHGTAHASDTALYYEHIILSHATRRCPQHPPEGQRQREQPAGYNAHTRLSTPGYGTCGLLEHSVATLQNGQYICSGRP